MKEKNIRVLPNSQGQPVLRRGKDALLHCLSEAGRYTVSEKAAGRKTDGRLNFAQVAAGTGLQPGFFTLVNGANGLFANVYVQQGPHEETGHIRLTHVVQDLVQLQPGDEVLLCRRQEAAFGKIRMQSIENVKEEDINIPCNALPEDYFSLFSMFELYNPLTQDALILRARHIRRDSRLKEGEIRLTGRQRALLGENVPARLTHSQWNSAKASLTQEAFQALEEAYDAEEKGYILRQAAGKMPYQEKEGLRKAIRECFGEQLVLRPVLTSFKTERKKPLLTRFSDFFVGKSVLSLCCKRPHRCDETADIVRMTEDNMHYMGLESMDRVVLWYKNRQTVCHVLPMENEAFDAENKSCLPQLSIGVPVHVRHRLGIYDLQSAVKVERDTGFLFRKSINEQLLPLLLALLSLSFFDGLTFWQSLLIVIAMSLVFMYMALSGRRSAWRKWKKERK